MRYEGIEFELWVASSYQSKVQSSEKRNIQFSLTLPEYRALLLRKKCAYSGLTLTHKGAGRSKNTQDITRFSDVTIERLDNNLPYTKTNCLAVAYGFNNLKSTYENPTCDAGFKELYKFVDTLRKLGVKDKQKGERNV